MDAEKIRLFVALAVPEQLKKQIKSLPETLLDFKNRTHPDDLHITLRFLGETEPDQLGRIEQALNEVRAPSAFNIEVSGLDRFGKKDKAVLYAAVPSLRKIALLVDDISRRLEPLGFVRESKPYIPHVTIARLRSERNVEDYIRRFGPRVRCQWKAAAFHLMKSAAVEEEAKRYSILRSYELPPY